MRTYVVQIHLAVVCGSSHQLIARMNRLRRKRKPDSVRLNLVTSRTRRGQGKINISRVSVPLILPESSQGGPNPNSTTGHRGAGELDLHLSDLPDEMDLSCLHNEQGTLTTAQYSKKRTHEDREEKAAESWARLRRGLLASLIESCCHPSEVPCCMCSAESSQVYCQDCGGYMCIQCAQKLHTHINIFHAPVMWDPMVNALQCIIVSNLNLTCRGKFTFHTPCQ